jgi:hypothetical protein
MKKLFFIVIAACLSSTAFAKDVTGPAWLCSLDAEVSGFSAGFIINVTKIDGGGVLRCTRPEDKMLVNVPVTVKLGGLGFGFGISKVESMKVGTLNVGVTDPTDMLGEFNAGLEADFTFVSGGAGVQVGVKGANGLAFDVGVMAKKADGLHVKAGGFVLVVEQDGEATYAPWDEN